MTQSAYSDSVYTLGTYSVSDSIACRELASRDVMTGRDTHTTDVIYVCVSAAL